MPRVIEFEGRQIEVPDDATDTDIEQVLSAQPAAPVEPAPEYIRVPEPQKPSATPIADATPAPPSERSWTDAIMDGASYAGGIVDQAGRGMAEGVTNILGLPNTVQQIGLNVADYGLEKLGAPQGVRDAFGAYRNAIDVFPSTRGMQEGLDTLNNSTADALGVERPRGEPENLPERVVNRVGEEVGAALLPVGATLQRARGMTPAQALSGNWFDRAFTAPATISPSRFTGRELGVAAAAGQGAAVANEVVDRDTGYGQVADILGALGGAGLYGVAGATGSAGRDVLAAYGGNAAAASRAVRDNVADTLLQNSDVVRQGINAADPEQVIDSGALATAILQPTRAEAVIPGFQASTADRAADAGLAALENARSKGVNVGRFRSRVNTNNEAVEGTLGRLAPDATPGTYRQAAELERDARIAAAVGDADIARSAFDDAVASAQPVLRGGAARGSNLRGALQDARDRVAANVDELYAPINQSDARVDIAPLRDRFAETTGELPLNDRQRFLPQEAAVPGQLAPEVQQAPINTGLLDAAGNPITRQPPAPDTTVPLSEVTSVRSGLTDDIRAANATPGRAQQARVANQFRSETDEYLDAILPPELRTQYDTARAARRDMADRFERPGTGIAETLRPREGGGYALDDSAVTSRFTPTDQGRVSDFQALMREAGTDQRARRAIEDELITDVQSNRLTDNPEQLRRYLNDRNVVLSEFPDLRNRLENIGVRREALTGAEKTAETTRRDLTTPGRSNVATYLQYGDAQSERAITNVLNAADPAKATDELASFVRNDPQAVEGLKASFWQKLDSASRSRNMLNETDNGIRPIVPQRLLRFLDDPKTSAVADRLYADNPQHLQDLRQIGEALRGVNLEQRVGKSINPSGTAQALRGSPSVTMAEVQSKLYQTQIGRVSPAYVVLHLAQKIARGAVNKQSSRAYERLLDEALLNPRIAAGLLMENNPANRAALARSAKGWLGNEAANFGRLLAEDDEDTNAIMDER